MNYCKFSCNIMTKGIFATGNLLWKILGEINNHALSDQISFKEHMLTQTLHWFQVLKKFNCLEIIQNYSGSAVKSKEMNLRYLGLNILVSFTKAFWEDRIQTSENDVSKFQAKRKKWLFFWPRKLIWLINFSLLGYSKQNRFLSF